MTTVQIKMEDGQRISPAFRPLRPYLARRIMASQNLVVVAVGYKNNPCKKVTAPQMGEHLMPPALLCSARRDPRRKDLKRPICHVRCSCSRIQIRQKKMKRRWNKRSALLLLLQYTECVCHAQQNNEYTLGLVVPRNIEHDLFGVGIVTNKT